MTTLTPKRRAWLEHLRDCGPAHRAKNNVGYCCMKAGWTEWWVKLDDGREMMISAARDMFPAPDHYSNHVERESRGTREMITDAGRAVLLAPLPMGSR